MSEGQGYYGGAGGYGAAPQPNPYAPGGQQPGPYAQGGANPYAQGNPYGQGVPQPNPYAQPNPYTQGTPQPAPYAQPTPYPQPIPARPAPAPAPAAPPVAPLDAAHLGPGPRRSRTAVLIQFTLQWIYAPLWIAALVALVVILLWSGASGPSEPKSDAWLKVNRTFIPPRRLKAELSGRPEVWERYLTPILERRIRAAEAKHAAGDGEVRDDFTRVMSLKFPVRLYRGLGAAGVARLAERYGWQGKPVLDPDRIWIHRTFPVPAPAYAPGPQDPPAAPGTPWGPRPTRPAMLLPFMFVLQFVYVPVFGLLTLLAFRANRPEPDYWNRWGARWTVGPCAFRAEFTGSAAAWERHIRRVLARRTGPQAGASTPLLPRRTEINLATYRGAGAQQVVRIAAEQGYVLDPAYTPEPQHCVRLYRPDQG